MAARKKIVPVTFWVLISSIKKKKVSLSFSKQKNLSITQQSDTSLFNGQETPSFLCSK